ncbi:hypothetical protein ASPWEDRAFT_739137 [Aspergillus wentii DTO 134E9]|uniref:NAD(P)-binding domain-containing protein n=1 Tax=Aspergillus wentii DTO 134E9 TaxID=1073089 RepID=A0A1L9RSE7_ASPWE|nr:uncharacterized protein ASPWEDRAFT_739137 [Aspergillus wentii DTO 134E9]KAI9930709.1 hypothetical protein MW887_011465 [Aspergillus wentii]OJJ37871.1 hypothetical protein ASPWEDRAFT_739137 [Aspergillus wentii DTO 134E9]
MAQTYIKNVAIVGAGGNVGKHFTEELLKTGKHTVTALTRVGGTSPVPEGVKRVEVDYDNSDSLVSALKGQEFLIITLSITTPPDTHGKIVKAASEAGVPYIMPNVYGSDIMNESMRKEDLYSGGAYERCLEVEKQGNTAYIAMACGFWYEWSLAIGEQWFGFDIKNRTVTFIDDGNTKITTSTFGQCGRAIAALLSLPESGAEPSVSQWKNKPFLHRVIGTTDADWTISYQPSKERYSEGLEEMKNGVRTGFVKAMYTRAFFPGGGGDFESTRGLANDVIGLAKDDLDLATKRSVDLVEAGWNPFA